MKKIKKIFHLESFLEPIQDSEYYMTRRMFGGLAIYYNEFLQLVLCESPGDRTWRGEEYPLDIWNGVLVCTSRELHAELGKAIADLEVHPVISKWLYLPMTSEAFETGFERLVEMIEESSPLVGVPSSRSK